MNGVAGELVKIAAGEYRLKIESGFLRVRKLEDDYGRAYWEVTDKLGTRYYFGRYQSTRQDNHANIDQIFRWCLDLVEDVHGNYMTFAYVKDQDQVYLSQIDYAGHLDQSGQVTMPPAHRVRFFLEDRADPWTSYAPRWTTIAYSPPFGVRMAKQLKSIAVYANNQVHATYAFAYSQSPSSERSLLYSVRRYGSDAVVDPASGVITSGTALPAQYFTYSLDEHQFAAQSNGPNLKVSGDPAWAAVDMMRVRYGDFNGDGKTDVLRITGEGSSAFLEINGSQVPGPYIFVSNQVDDAKVDLARVKLGDFNGDGRTDVAWVVGLGSSALIRIYYAANDGSEFYGPYDGPPITLGDTQARRLIDLARIKLGDFNGDGKTDILIVNGWGSTQAVSIYHASASGGVFDPPVSGPSFSIAGTETGAQVDMARFQVADFNGNGRSDLLYVNSAGQVKVYYSYPSPGGVGGGMVLTSVNGPPLSIRTDSALALVDLSRLLLGDFNGDGLADLGYIDGLDAWMPIKIYHSTGTNFIEGPPGPDAYVAASAQGGQIDVARVGVGDFNGDGKTDIYRVDAAGSTSPYFFLSTGDSFFVGIHYGPYFYVDPDPAKTLNNLERIRVGDFNGDGKIDLSRVEGSSGTLTPLRIHLADGPFADLLTTMTNGIGGAQTIAYQSSTSVYPNTSLPRPLQVVSSITACDDFRVLFDSLGIPYYECVGLAAITNYEYGGGYYHAAARDFRGFNYAKVTGPAGPNGERSISETWFHQGNDTAVDANDPYASDGFMKGKPYRARITDGYGNVYSEVMTIYTADADGVAPFFTPPAQVDSSVCDGNACGLQARTAYTYDGYGNVTYEYQYGNINDASDDRTIARAFSPNTTAWIVGQPSSEVVYEGIGGGVKRSEATYFYDGASDCTTPPSGSPTPGKGNLTRVVRWLQNPDGSDPPDPETWMGYDAYGNLACSRDANGNISRAIYDSTQTFPIISYDPELHATATEYYGVDGVSADQGLYGQIKKVIEPNGSYEVYQYDLFGRLSEKYLYGVDGGLINITSMYYENFGQAGQQKIVEVIEDNTQEFEQEPLCQTGTYVASSNRCVYREASSYPATYNQQCVLGMDVDGSEFYTCTSSPGGQCKISFTYSNTIIEIIGKFDNTCNLTSPYLLQPGEDWNQETFNLSQQGSYVCNQGGTLSGTSCINTITRNSTPVCPSGTVLDGTTDKCVQWAALTCSSGTYNSNSKKCVSTSTSTYPAAWNSLVCRIDAEDFYDYEGGGSCIASPGGSCAPDGTSFIFDSYCNTTSPYVIPVGGNKDLGGGYVYWNRSSYSGTWTCNPGDILSGSTCTRTTYIYSDPTCSSGFFSPYLDACIVGQNALSNYIWKETYFDGHGKVIKFSKSGPAYKEIIQETQYGANGNLIKRSIPHFSNETPQYVVLKYDPVGRILEVQKPDLTKEKVCYDRGVTVRIDANGHRKRETRDVQGRLIKVEEYEGIYSSCTTDVGTPYATTTYQYDRVGNLLAVTDTNSNATTMTYDTLGRKFSMYDPDMGAWNYGYDDNGNLIWQRDAKGQTISFQHDSLNRLLRKDYPTGTDVTLAYDEASYHGYSGGRLTTMTDASGSTRYDYDDSLARTTRMTKNIDGVNYTITTRVDGLGRAASITYPDGETVTNSYDSGGNLRKVGNYLTLSGFTAIGQPGQEAFGNGVSTYYGYNTQTKRLSTLQVYNGSQFIQLLNHTYDLRGNVTSISASNWNSTTGSWDSARSQTFQYDALDRLKQAQSTAYGTLGYAYDKIGNLAAKEGVTFTPAPARPHAVGVSSDGQSYTYDANGNMLSDGTRTITWDYDNRPASITVGGATTSFVYDGMGNRVKKIGPAGAIVYIDKLYEVSGGVGAKYIYANGKRIALKTPTQTYYYHGNHLGSTSLVTDAARNVVEEIFYKPFGDSFTDSGSISLNHKYTGQELDAETGLYFYNARYYNPAIGRFISADTIVPDPADPQAFNRYSYVLNNPLKYIDPTGHDFVITGGGGGVLVQRELENPDV